MSYSEWLAAICLWREGRGLSLSALAGIWNVIQNRMNDAHNRWPKTISGVITQHAQFSSFLQSDPNVTKFPVEPSPGKPASPDWNAFLDCMTVVTGALNPDNTNGANSYESLPADADKPDWADPSKMTVQIGPIRFYKL